MRRALTAVVFAALLVMAVAACGSSSSSTETPASTPATTPAAADTGAPGGGDTSVGVAVFKSNCAGCHGTDGSGGVGPDLQGEDSLDKVIGQVTNGGVDMPPFEGQLSTAEIQSVAEYVTNGFN